MKTFEQIKTTSSQEAVNLLMLNAFFAIPEISEEKVIQEYKQVEMTWQSKELFKGSSSKIKELIIRNLQEYERDDHFQYFYIEVYQDQYCAQITTLFGNYGVGVRVWRTHSAAFVCGNANFCSEPIGYIAREAFKGNNTVLKALQDKRPNLAKELIVQGSDLQQYDDYGNTSIHYAAALGYLDVLQELISRNVNPETRNHQGQTPLLYAMEYHQYEAAKILWAYQRSMLHHDGSILWKYIEELCCIGTEKSLQAKDVFSGFYQKYIPNNDNDFHQLPPDDTFGRTVFEEKAEMCGWRYHPRVRQIGWELHALGGFSLMQEAAEVISSLLGSGALRELSSCWHLVGDWLD